MVFNATFHNISVIIVPISFFGGGNWSTRIKPQTCRKCTFPIRCRRGCDHMVVGFITTYVISAHHH
jgi:hypothetical protein